MLKIELIDDISGLDRLEPYWDSLLAAGDTDYPFMTLDWFRLFWSHYRQKMRLLVLVFSQDSEPVAIAPFMLGIVKWRGLPVTQISFIANYDSPRVGMLGPVDKNLFTQAVRYLRRKAAFDMFYLDFIDTGSDTYRSIKDLISGKKFRYRIMPAMESPYIRVDSSWEDYLKTRSDKFRDKIKRVDKQVNKRLNGSVRHFHSPEDVPRAMEAIMKISANSWKFKLGSAIASSPGKVVFLRRLAQVAAKHGWLDIAVLEAGEEPTAFTFELRYKGKSYLLKSEFDERFSRFSPGLYLLNNEIKQAFLDGCEEIDLLGRNEGYKLNYTLLTRPHAKFFIFNRTFAGNLLFMLENRLIAGARELLKKPSAPGLGNQSDPESLDASRASCPRTGREKVARNGLLPKGFMVNSRIASTS